MTFAEINAAYGNYLWMGFVTIITFFSMFLMKKVYVPVTKRFSSTAKGRRTVNSFFGAMFSVGIASPLGAFLTTLVATEVHFMWFVASGLLANYIYLLFERTKDANLLAMGKSVADAGCISNKKFSEEDIPEIANEMNQMTEKFKNSESNIHAKEVRNVAAGIVGAVGISQKEIVEIDQALAELEKAGLDVSLIKAKWENSKADGIVTEQERKIAKQAIEIFNQLLR